MGLFDWLGGGSKKKVVVCSDPAEMTALIAQLTTAVASVEEQKVKAEGAIKVVEEIMAQLRTASAAKDQAVATLKEAETVAQQAIETIGSIKLTMGLK